MYKDVISRYREKAKKGEQKKRKELKRQKEENLVTKIIKVIGRKETSQIYRQNYYLNNFLNLKKERKKFNCNPTHLSGMWEDPEIGIYSI